MKKQIIFSAILMVGISAQSAMGANWVDTFASSAENKEKNSLDLSTIKGYYFDYDYSHTKGYYVTAWIKADYRTPQKLNNGKLYRQTKTLYYFDCDNKKLVNGEMIFYTSTGGLVASQKGYATTYTSDSWNKAIPDSVGDALLNSACNAYTALYKPT